MVVVFVNKHHLKVGIAQAVGQLQSTKAAANDDDTLLLGSGYVKTHIASALKVRGAMNKKARRKKRTLGSPDQFFAR